MTNNLSAPVASKQTAKNTVYRLLNPFLIGFFKDNCWKAPGQIFNSIRALGGAVEINKTEYFGEMAGKRWYLEIGACGFSFSGILTATFADKPNGERYDLTLVLW